MNKISQPLQIALRPQGLCTNGFVPVPSDGVVTIDTQNRQLTTFGYTPRQYIASVTAFRR